MSEELMKIEMEKNMITDSHKRDSRGSERDHNRRKEKEDAKANGIWKQLMMKNMTKI